MPASRTFKTLALFLAVAAGLAGCAQTPPIRAYEPEAGPYTARLLVRPSLREKDGYGVYLLNNAQQCGDAQRISVGNVQSSYSGTLLRAERLSTLSTMIVTPEGRCSSVLSFVPRTGRSYALHLATEDKSCWSYLFDVTDPDKTFAEPSVRRRDNSTSACLPLASSRAPAAAAAEPPPTASAPARPSPSVSTP